MKIGLLSSHRGQKIYEQEHKEIISYLENKGHEVIHSMDVSIESLTQMTYIERENSFLKFYQHLEECDLIFAECSMQSTQVGFGLSYLRARGKPVVMLEMEGTDPKFTSGDEPVYSNIENLMVCEYNPEHIGKTLDEALIYMEPHINKRFTIIFPGHLLARVEEVAQKNKLPKAVYIRQLIEKSLLQE